METSLHQQLKCRYAATPESVEVVVGGYRIDAISPTGELVEVQHASLSAIRDKCRNLLAEHELRVVKPIVARKWIVGLKKKNGKVVRRRLSPKKGQLADLFAELTHFMTVFPHPRLTIEVPLIDTEELRYPHARRGGKQYRIEDQRLLEVHRSVVVRTPEDLLALLAIAPLGAEFPEAFHTGDLAQAMRKPRWLAQKTAYCFRQAGCLEHVGKKGNAILYRWSSDCRELLRHDVAEKVA